MSGRRLWAGSAGVLTILTGIFWSLPAAAEDRTCQISEVAGTASVVSAGNRNAATAGVALAGTDELRTGKDGRVEVTCSDQTVVTVGPSSDISLGSLVGPKGGNIGMSLHRGIARFLAPAKTWGAFNVFGPVAVASVRSTEWIMETPKKGTNVFVISGVVQVRAKAGGNVFLAGGQGVDVDAAGAMGEPKVWGEERVAATKKKLGLE